MLNFYNFFNKQSCLCPVAYLLFARLLENFNFNFMQLTQKLVNLSSKPKFWCTFTGFLELFLICHGIDSYSSIEYICRENNFFPDFDEDEQKLIYARILSICLITAFIFQFIVTILNDTYGMWVSRSLFHFSQLSGLIVILIMTPDTSWLCYLAFPLFFGGGAGIITTNVLCFELWPKLRGFLSSLLGVPILLSQLWYLYYVNLGKNWKIFWAMLIGFIPFSLARTFLLCPRYKVVGPETILGLKSKNLGKFQDSGKNYEKMDEKEDEKKESVDLSFSNFII